jgi:hypothetical protein
MDQNLWPDRSSAETLDLLPCNVSHTVTVNAIGKLSMSTYAAAGPAHSNCKQSNTLRALKRSDYSRNAFQSIVSQSLLAAIVNLLGLNPLMRCGSPAKIIVAMYKQPH